MTAPATALADFQGAFHAALWRPEPDAQAALADACVAALAAQPGFAVYRNTVLKGCIDALEANYPAVARLVGRDWFRAAAAIHVRAAPPTDARLMGYGAGFAGFIEQFAPARQLPYLADVARIERAWTESHLAADAPVLDAGALAALAPEALGAAVLRPHPATRWTHSAQHPALTLWQRNREAGADEAGDIDWQPEGALLTRPDGAVQVAALGAGGCAFLDACAAGQSLADAAGAALAADAAADIAALLALLLGAGAFSALNTPR